MKLNVRMKGVCLGAAMAFLLLAAGTSAAQTQVSCPTPVQAADCVVTLGNVGTVTPSCSSGPFSVAVGPVPLPGPWSAACIRVDVTTQTDILVETTYGAPASGWTFHVADSFTNNGFGGDAATQENDSEAQVLGKTLTVYANQKGSSNPIYQVVFPTLGGGNVCYKISDQFIGWKRGVWYGSSSTLTSPPNQSELELFAFLNQTDIEDPSGFADNFVWICGNRVMDGGSPGAGGRVGSGLSKMRIRALP